MKAASFHHYLPIEEELFHDGFYVTGGGRTRIDAGSVYPPGGHPSFYHFTWTEGRVFPEFAIILITKGNGFFESQETELRRIEAGQVMLLFPGIWHRYRPDPKTGWTEKWVQFSGEFAHKLWDRGILSSTRPVLSPGHFPNVEAALEKLLQEIEQRPGFNSLRYALQVSQLLALLLEALPEPERRMRPSSSAGVPGETLLADAQNYIWTYSQLAISVQDIADHLGIGRRTLERRFQAQRGCTVLEEVTRCRYNRAERLLRETSLPVKAVAYLAGFGKTENMRQAFMKQSRLSPRAYRASCRRE